MAKFDLRQLAWRTSTRTANGGQNCVEVAVAKRVVLVRDSKDRTGPVLAVPGGGWCSFITAIHCGAFDLADRNDG